MCDFVSAFLDTVAVFWEAGLSPELKSHHLCCLSSSCLWIMAHVLPSLANFNCRASSLVVCPHGQASFEKFRGEWKNREAWRLMEYVIEQIQTCRTLSTRLEKIFVLIFKFLLWGTVLPCQELDWMACLIFLVLCVMSMWLCRQKNLTVINSKCFQLLV